MENKQISVWTQIVILVKRQFYILKANSKKILMVGLLPVVTAIIVGLVSSEDTFITYEDTKSTLFTMVCVAIWIGLFNSIQEICQERGILKREYMANLKIFAYVTAKFIVQFILCLLQSLVFLGVCMLLMDFPSEGVVSESFFIDVFISLFLLMLASDMLGLFVSSIVKSGDIANITAPIILIVQLVLSGVLFDLNGFTEKISYITFSKWGMDSLGSIVDLNNLELRVVAEAKDDATRNMLESVIEREFYDGFEAVPKHIWFTWIVLFLFIVLLIAVSSLILRRISKDAR